MKTFNITEFRRMPLPQLLDSLPALVTSDGMPAFILAKPDEAIIIGDMHPRVQKQLKAQEAKARNGMAPVEQIFRIPNYPTEFQKEQETDSEE